MPLFFVYGQHVNRKGTDETVRQRKVLKVRNRNIEIAVAHFQRDLPLLDLVLRETFEVEVEYLIYSDSSGVYIY